jgi:hypothetical protein
LLAERQLSFCNIEIGSTDATGTNPEKHLTRDKLGCGNLLDMKRLF